MNDIEFVEKTNRFLNGKFSLGDRSKGWDCLNSMAEFFDSIGVKFPREFGDWNESNYADRWNRGEGMQTFKDFLLSLGEPVDLNYIRPGDIIVLEKPDRNNPKELIVSAGLYLGGGHFQAVHNIKGVIRLPLDFFRIAIVGVRRLIKR